MKKPFLEAVAAGPLVFDGGIGTQLYERGVYINRSFDDANLSRADLVRQIHEDYLDAGAQILTTNTFAANRIKLRRHGLEDKLEAINREGARIAREVAGDDPRVVESFPSRRQEGTLSAAAVGKPGIRLPTVDVRGVVLGLGVPDERDAHDSVCS